MNIRMIKYISYLDIKYLCVAFIHSYYHISLFTYFFNNILCVASYIPIIKYPCLHISCMEYLCVALYMSIIKPCLHICLHGNLCVALYYMLILSNVIVSHHHVDAYIHTLYKYCIHTYTI
jgi:hypothetical protein